MIPKEDLNLDTTKMGEVRTLRGKTPKERPDLGSDLLKSRAYLSCRVLARPLLKNREHSPPHVGASRRSGRRQDVSKSLLVIVIDAWHVNSPECPKIGGVDGMILRFHVQLLCDFTDELMDLRIRIQA